MKLPDGQELMATSGTLLFPAGEKPETITLQGCLNANYGGCSTERLIDPTRKIDPPQDAPKMRGPDIG
jgi:hypothetical protein